MFWVMCLAGHAFGRCAHKTIIIFIHKIIFKKKQDKEIIPYFIASLFIRCSPVDIP